LYKRNIKTRILDGCDTTNNVISVKVRLWKINPYPCMKLINNIQFLLYFPFHFNLNESNLVLWQFGKDKVSTASLKRQSIQCISEEIVKTEGERSQPIRNSQRLPVSFWPRLRPRIEKVVTETNIVNLQLSVDGLNTSLFLLFGVSYCLTYRSKNVMIRILVWPNLYLWGKLVMKVV